MIEFRFRYRRGGGHVRALLFVSNPAGTTGANCGMLRMTREEWEAFKLLAADNVRFIDEAPWSTDMATAKQSNRPVLIARRGEKLEAMAIFIGQEWRHAQSLEPVCFTPDIWHPLPTPPG